jgi:hypothetical protein
MHPKAFLHLLEYPTNGAKPHRLASTTVTNPDSPGHFMNWFMLLYTFRRVVKRKFLIFIKMPQNRRLFRRAEFSSTHLAPRC